jgi:Tol biopolymer transport system component
MNCPKCHADNPDTSRFCGNCATSLTSAKATPHSFTETLDSPVHAVTPGTVYGGRYEILGQIGAGGMGEVYRAIDKNLGRHIAIKVLPSAFAEDKERMARFEREAKLLAVLNHSNIAAIHGLEESEGRRFLVLELAEGETLQARLNRGALPVEEALETCRELAEGLEAAHEKGIIHRDLKPGNIMITPEGKVKILDFGLAKAYGGETTNVDIEKSPTITAQMTEPGVILGTAAYMSPEQARGRAADRRADIWAFGCVLYECLTGSRAFHGETVSDTLAHILKGEPDWSKLPAETQTRIKVLLRRCLEKDPNKRLHDIADARLEIETPADYTAQGVLARRRLSFLWLVACTALALFAGILVDHVLIRHPPSTLSAPIVTSTIKVEPGHWLDGLRRAQDGERPSRTSMAISADGRILVYSAIEENPGPQAKPQLYLRRMNQGEAMPIVGTEGGINPFLSPDSRWVGFWEDGKLKKVPVEGGVPTTLCDAAEIFGASWSPDDSIVFAEGQYSRLLRVSADGGKPESLTSPEPKREEGIQRLPSWLPNGKAVLITVMRHPWDSQPGIALLRPDTREWHTLLPDAADAKYVPTGHLVFLRQGTLMAVRFDAVNLKVVGQPSPIVDNVMQTFVAWGGNNTGAGQFSISDSGSLVYAAGGVLPDMQNSLVWVDQRGSEQPVAPLRFPFQAPRLSPDGQRIAYVTQGREWQVFIYDLNTDTNSRLTHEGMSARAIWTPDGERIIFHWRESSASNLFSQPYDGSSPMERLTTSDDPQYIGSWSSDGKTLALVESHSNAGHDIALLEISSGRMRPFLNSQFNETFPEFSPDGRWIAYASDESGREEVYVRPFPAPGMKHQMSSQGGIQPLWARNGRQLFYRWKDQVWAVDIRTDGGFSTGKPRLLFERPGYSPGSPTRNYDLSLDGQRFLMVKLEQRKPSPVTEMTLVQNWFEELKRLVPTGKK